jgi:hypothetical protein
LTLAGINDKGQIVGTAQLPTGASEPLLFAPDGPAERLQPLRYGQPASLAQTLADAGISQAHAVAINNQGWILISYEGGASAILDSQSMSIVVKDIPFTGQAMSESGLVAGQQLDDDDDGTTEVWVYNPATGASAVTDTELYVDGAGETDDPNFAISGINSSGVLVGTFMGAGETPLVWSLETTVEVLTPFDLDPHLSLLSASGINDAGLIAADAIYTDPVVPGTANYRGELLFPLNLSFSAGSGLTGPERSLALGQQLRGLAANIPDKASRRATLKIANEMIAKAGASIAKLHDRSFGPSSSQPSLALRLAQKKRDQIRKLRLQN